MDEKDCVVCGRRITFRKKWERNWSEIKYCSDACRSKRSHKSSDDEAILALLQTRGRGKTICPSEILSDVLKQDKERMEQVRQAARRLVHAGKIVILQNNQIVDPSSFRGPIRLRLV